MDDFARHLLASSPAVVFVCKAGGDYGGLYVSENIRELIGYRPEEFLEDSGFWKDHLHPDDAERVLAGLEAVFTEGRHVCEYRFLARNGEYRWMRDELRLVHNPVTGADELVGSWLDITERKEMEEDYRRLAGLTSDYVHYCTRRGAEPYRVKWVDGAVNPISGYSIADILEMGCWLPLVHPDDRERVSAYLLGLVPGDRKTIEFRIITRNRQVRWVSEKSRCEVGAIPGELVLLGAVTDVTELKRAERALLDSENFLREAAQIARLGRWRWNIVTDEGEWSTMTQEIFGLELLDRKITYADFIAAVHPDDRGAVETALHNALQNGSDYAIEHRIVLPNGTVRHVQEKAVVRCDVAGKPVRMVGTVLDVTEQKHVETRLRDSDRTKSEFIATASHELRTPVAIIQGYSELLLGGGDFPPEQQREFLSIIHDKAIALEKIVDGLLDVSRIESGRILCLEFAAVDIVDEIRRLVAQFEKESHGHRFSLELPEAPLVMPLDRAKIVRVLENLLSNAVKYSPPGSEVSVTAAVGEGCFQVGVADRGVGLSPENRERVFDKFYRVETADTAAPGLGLGLYLVKKIVEAHRGRVWVESTLGAGSSFYFCLPLPGAVP